MVTIDLDHVSATYDGRPALDDVDLQVHDREFFSVVGPSGCGKSTLLRTIAGLETPSSGDVRFDGCSVAEVRPQRRDVALVFQSFALYPHLTVTENVGFPLALAHERPSEIAARVAEVLRLLGLSRFADRRPDTLSGGERQRVALGRAIIRRPRAVLMDEPLSNLDAGLRADMRAAIHRLHLSLGLTTVYVTHDQVEAMAMADTVAVMREGRIVQCGPPSQVHDDPVDVFVATFLGSPPMSLLSARLDVDDRGLIAGIGSCEVALGPAPLAAMPQVRARLGSTVLLGVRADAVAIDPDGDLRGEVVDIETWGHEAIVTCSLPGTRSMPVEAIADIDGAGHAGLRVTVRPDVASHLSAWRPLRLRIDPSRIHLFDADTGVSLRAPAAVGAH